MKVTREKIVISYLPEGISLPWNRKASGYAPR